jgi:hypothetical protein
VQRTVDPFDYYYYVVDWAGRQSYPHTPFMTDPGHCSLFPIRNDQVKPPEWSDNVLSFVRAKAPYWNFLVHLSANEGQINNYFNQLWLRAESEIVKCARENGPKIREIYVQMHTNMD